MIMMFRRSLEVYRLRCGYLLLTLDRSNLPGLPRLAADSELPVRVWRRLGHSSMEVINPPITPQKMESTSHSGYSNITSMAISGNVRI